MDQADVLAECRLIMESDGITSRREVALQIGHPQWGKGGDDAFCAIAIKGLYDDLPPVRGRDFFDALVQAVRTLRLHCRKPPEGVHFFYFHEPPHDRQPYKGEPWDEEERAAAMERFDAPYRKDWSVLVERKILMRRDASEERKEVTLQIGHPYWIKRGDVEMATCPIAMKGDDGEWLDHRDGDDLFEALSDAVLHINLTFERPGRRKYFFWPDGKPYAGDFAHLPPRRGGKQRDPRGVAGNWQVLAERTLLMEREDGKKRTQIAIRIGRPYWREERKEVDWPFEIAGLYDNMGPMPGRDSYALISVLEFFDRYVRRNDQDTRYFWPDGTPYEGESLYLEPYA